MDNVWRIKTYRPTRFETEYLCRPVENRTARALWEIGMEFHCRTEAYDRARCRYKNERGIAIPCESSELGDCSNNTRRVKKDIMDKHGIDYIDFQRAVRMTTRKFEDNVVSFLDQWYAEEKVMKNEKRRMV